MASEKPDGLVAAIEAGERRKQRQAKYNATPKGKARNAKYRRTEKSKARNARYRRTAKGKACDARHRRTEEGKDSHARHERSERGKANRARYWRSEKGKAKMRRSDARRRGATLSAERPLTAADWLHLVATSKFRCYYCKQKKTLTMDHIIPVSKGGHHTRSNIVPACRSCNSIKGNRLMLLC